MAVAALVVSDSLTTALVRLGSTVSEVVVAALVVSDSLTTALVRLAYDCKRGGGSDSLTAVCEVAVAAPSPQACHNN